MVMVNSQGPMPGMDFSVPDIYLQFVALALVPTPLFSIAFRATVLATCFRFLLQGTPCHHLLNQALASLSGPGPGVASGMVCSASKNIKGSGKLIVQAMPATRSLIDPTVQNGLLPNSVGTTLPSQVQMASLA